MSEGRMIDEVQDEFMLALLHSVDFDTPPRGSMARTALAIGVSSAALAGATTLGTGMGASGAAAATGKTTLLLALKGLLIGGAVGTAVVTSAVVLTEGTRARSPTADPARGADSLSFLAPPSAPPAAEVARARTAPRVEQPGTARAAFPDVAPIEPGRGSGALGLDDQLGREVAWIDRSRRLLKQGRADAALTEIERYERESASRELGTEAALVRVEALTALGRRGEAVQLARRLLATGIRGPRRETLERLIEGD